MILSQYAIKLNLQQMSKDEFEEKWSMLMDANIDCVTDLDISLKGPSTQYISPILLFKTKNERGMAMAMFNLSK